MTDEYDCRQIAEHRLLEQSKERLQLEGFDQNFECSHAAG
jgi:hypothetical protein